MAWWWSHWCKVNCKVLWSMQLGAVIKCWAAYQKHSRGTFWQWRFIPKPQTPVSHVLVEIRWLSYFHRWHWYETILKPCAPSSLALLGSSDGWPIKDIWKDTYLDKFQKLLKSCLRTGALINRATLRHIVAQSKVPKLEKVTRSPLMSTPSDATWWLAYHRNLKRYIWII